jgi:hypothetical protein
MKIFEQFQKWVKLLEILPELKFMFFSLQYQSSIRH